MDPNFNFTNPNALVSRFVPLLCIKIGKMMQTKQLMESNKERMRMLYRGKSITNHVVNPMFETRLSVFSLQSRRRASESAKV